MNNSVSRRMPKKRKLSESEKRVVLFMFSLATLGIFFSILLAFVLKAD